MKLVAQVRVVVCVPFDAPVDELQEPDQVETRDSDGRIRYRIVDVAGYEAELAKVDGQRAAAARVAEDEVLRRVREALAGVGEIQVELVEEVRQP